MTTYQRFSLLCLTAALNSETQFGQVWHRIYVVRRDVAIHNVELLVGSHREDVRLIQAALLLDYGRLIGSIKSAVVQALSDEDDHVLQTAFRIGHDVLTQDWSRMLFGAAGVSGHIDGCGFGHSAPKLHFTFDGGCARRATCRTGRTSRSYDVSA